MIGKLRKLLTVPVLPIKSRTLFFFNFPVYIVIQVQNREQILKNVYIKDVKKVRKKNKLEIYKKESEKKTVCQNTIWQIMESPRRSGIYFLARPSHYVLLQE